jgi:putative membrane protein
MSGERVASDLLNGVSPPKQIGQHREVLMFNRISLPIVLLVAATGCNRAPTPQPEQAIPDKVVPSYQAATPSGAIRNDGATRGNGATPGSGGGGSVAGVVTLNDSQIARITNDANTAEIEQGKLAQVKAKEPRVKKFAERMVKHHTEAKAKQAKLNLETAASDPAMKLEHDADKTLSDLKANSDASFDAEYMAAQVQEHQQVLDTIDQQLLPNAKNEDLKGYLKDIRPTVESHLKDARDIQAKLTHQAANTIDERCPNRASSPRRPPAD